MAQPQPVKSAGTDGIPEAIADRRYSRDTTLPEDYEPPVPIDYAHATLTQIADHFKTDKGAIKHNYTAVYERFFSHLRNQPVSVLEIGVACGASLKMWSRYLGTEARIVGLDIRSECAALCRGYDNIEIAIADACEYQPNEKFDIVIDDGSHASLDIVRAFERLWSSVRIGGHYVIEDLRATHDLAYAQNFPFPKDPDHFRREYFLDWLDVLLRAMDDGRSNVAFVHYTHQLMILGKR